MPRLPQGRADIKVESQLTPMIDIVFQLLIFFILTFKVVAVEGQFNIKMPQTAQAAAETDAPPPIPPLTVRLDGDGDGELKQIVLGTRILGTDLGALEFELGEAHGIGIGVEIDADPKLKFAYLVEALNICQRLNITDIKFAPPREG